MDLDLREKVVLVTAASEGLGFATANLLIKEGAKVAICSRSIDKLKQNYATQLNATENIHLFAADITEKKSINALVNSVIERFGHLDMLVTNIAGPPLTDFDTVSDDDWSVTHQAIVMSCIWLINACLPYLRQSECASILTVTSMVTKQYLPGFLLSSVYRSAVIGLTKSLSKELGADGIRINSILPGYTMTNRLHSAIENRAAKLSSTVSDVNKQISHSIPLQRIGDPTEFAKAAVFLLSPAASYITGVMLQVDGGFVESIF